MTLFRTLLAIMFIGVTIYTAIVVMNHGANLVPVFFNDIKAMTWPGQFDLDFLCFLILSGLWVSWRHHFSAGGLALGVVATFGGIMFLAPYLFYTSLKVRGDIPALLLGPKRAASIN